MSTYVYLPSTSTCTLTSSSVTHSTDTFYGVLCSGLTDKTRISFISSNSSFSECVRKHIYHSSNLLSNACPATASDSLCEDQSFGSSGHQDPTHSTTFSKCTFTGCSSTNGGAVYVKGGSVSFLKIMSCTFSQCTATQDNAGAVYVHSISSFDVTDSSFLQCTCAGTDMYKHGGGSIFIAHVTCLSVLSSAFINNYCGRDGAGISLEESNAPTQQVILRCRFIKCVSIGESADGGGIHIYENNRNLGLSNCLFSLCESNNNGGALFHHLKFSETEHSICFCFFHQNKCTSANDVYLYPSGSTKTIFHSFSSTTITPRIGPAGNDDNWLP